jgi:hypothetical protein
MRPLLDEMIAAAQAAQTLRIDMETGEATTILNMEKIMQAALDVVERRLFKPYFDVRLKNAISRMNLNRPDIAALGDGGIISKNITCEREVDAILKEMLEAWKSVKES